MHIRKRALLVLGALCLAPAIAYACSVPVFRYALEHWQPDPYRLYLYHEHDLTESDQKLSARIAEHREAGANIELRTIDLRSPMEDQDRARWEALADKSTPLLCTHLPSRAIARQGGLDAPIGTAPWNEKVVQGILSSPVRVEIGERLVAGEVVWVFLESGNVAEDDALFKVLNQELEQRQNTLKLPAIEEQDLAELSANPTDLKIRFSSLRVSRTDPVEKWFVDMLLSVESDLRDEEIIQQPMVFPVFGRGNIPKIPLPDGRGDFVHCIKLNTGDPSTSTNGNRRTVRPFSYSIQRRRSSVLAQLSPSLPIRITHKNTIPHSNPAIHRIGHIAQHWCIITNRKPSPL